METFFGALVSVSLILTWAAGAKVTAVFEAPRVAVDICTDGTRYQTPAAMNAVSLTTAAVAPFGRTEDGWQIYAPQIARTIGTPCEPDTKGFAATLATWQAQHHIQATGAVNAMTLVAMKNTWQEERPFVEHFQGGGACPDAPAETALANVTPREGWSGKISKLDPHALENLRRMINAARAEDPEIARDRQAFQVVSAFRSPAYDAGRCAKDGNCNGIARARCSAHRTGRAVDLYIGALPGQSPVSSDDANRLYQTKTPTYRWLVKNAARFGFVNYVFEPWHWEWIGTTPAPETRMIEAVAVKPLSDKQITSKRVVTASMVSTPPLTRIALRLRALFGSSSE
jgi:uncharacterized protein YcbK (DUF882 family)